MVEKVAITNKRNPASKQLALRLVSFREGKRLSAAYTMDTTDFDENVEEDMTDDDPLEGELN